ncbi:hypothetical protein M407DRAFT_244668 [Tulasnella calospora MUT 4182]|uniref:Uncharacterized protein n=1 Tax=Tulasnella calospora MUT 4182 TaxID=1051891 RepID=A0A0C3QF38_9AGAM|nr:hypothetical protein M407DRAFT_244668 [Tulasnella calospora MUT 4182]
MVDSNRFVEYPLLLAVMKSSLSAHSRDQGITFYERASTSTALSSTCRNPPNTSSKHIQTFGHTQLSERKAWSGPLCTSSREITTPI